jgi:hypothetical protein
MSFGAFYFSNNKPTTIVTMKCVVVVLGRICTVKMGGHEPTVKLTYLFAIKIKIQRCKFRKYFLLFVYIDKNISLVYAYENIKIQYTCYNL